MTRTRHLASALALTAALATTACGEQSAGSVAAVSADVPQESFDGSESAGAGGATGASAGERRVVRLARGEVKPELECPTGDRSVMIADFAHGAKGAATPEEAVGRGVEETRERLVVSARGATAWVLRADGTARDELHLVRQGGGWVLHMRTSCG